MMRNGDCVV